jgi:SAM-dependent methyltransferase
VLATWVQSGQEVVEGPLPSVDGTVGHLGRDLLFHGLVAAANQKEGRVGTSFGQDGVRRFRVAATKLATRGANVLAVEPSLVMLGRLSLPSVCGRAEALPLRSASQELLTCAQAWHWVEPIRAVSECGRVIRSGGHLALWWNISDSKATWLSDVQSVSGIRPYGLGSLQDDPATLTAGGGFAGVEYRDISWRWTVPVDQWLRVASTRSSSVNLVRHGRELPVEDMRAALHQHFPGGEVTETFTCHLAVAIRI